MASSYSDTSLPDRAEPGNADGGFYPPLGVSLRSPLGLRVVRQADLLEILPGKLPLAFIIVWTAGLYALILWLLPWGQDARPADDTSWLFVVLPPLIFLFMWGMLFAMNRSEQRKGPLARLDKSSGVLELPRAGVSLHAADIVEFVETHGWLKYGWYTEISVATRPPDGRRHPLVFTVTQRSAVSRLATELADFFAVPLRHAALPKTARERQAGRESLRISLITLFVFSAFFAGSILLGWLDDVVRLNSTARLILGVVFLLAAFVTIIFLCFFWRPRCPNCGHRARFAYDSEQYEFLACKPCGFHEPTGRRRSSDPG